MNESAKARRARKGETDLHELLALAAASAGKDERLMRSAVRDAIRLSERLRLRMPLEEKRKLCKKCYAYLRPGVTSRSRVRSGRVIITCLSCGNVKRLQYRR